ncbi:ditrans,polycis-undecaprenyl-diphosphate synthase ((2E,6E)-farnesyl-diphosphate specific)-like, partial [Octopus sinensis]|uniref:ditrans,polycis-polyprenyl diphosphate synthase [(2E,6E)-farnesyldiphosphate specific] n=1 Tax=Octopus sinensis TaxID=2607531 RepID=A0A6P7U3C2_9MOLL
VSIRFLGDLSRLPPDIQSLAEIIQQNTKSNCQNILNIAIAYTSRGDMLRATSRVISECSADALNENDMDRMLSTSDILKPDILLRTGGEHRFSDFLLWEVDLL